MPTALTIEQIQRVREATAVWRTGGGPKPDRQLDAIIEVMLGTSARIGEVLALRRCDVDVTGSPLTPNNVRRQLRTVLDTAGVESVTPHAFRRTVATTLNREAGVELAAAMLGHSSHATTEEHYIEKPDLVDPRTAEVLEVLGPDGGGSG